MRYLRSAVVTLLFRGIAIPIGIASSIITARYLGPSGRGVLAFLLVLQGLAVQFGTIGFNSSTTYFLTRHQHSGPRVVSNAFTVAIFNSFGIMLLIYALSFFAPEIVVGEIDVWYLNVFLISVPGVFLQQFLQSVFIATDRITEFNMLDISVRFFQLVAFVVVLIVLQGSTRSAVITLTVSGVLAGGLYTLRAYRAVPFHISFDYELFKQMFRFGGRTYLASILMFLIFRANIFYINAILGTTHTGVYSVALQFVDLVYLVPVTLGMLLFPKVSANANDDGALTAKIFRISIVVIGTASIILVILSRPIVFLMFGDKFNDAILPLQLLSPGIFALSLVTILNNDLTARGVPSVVIYSPGVALVVNSAIHFLFLRTYGLPASALASTLSYSVMLLLLYRRFVCLTGMPHRRMLFLMPEDFRKIG